MEKKQRLTGIDLFRGIAVYAVVILHSDEGISVSPASWSKIAQFSGFAVPFFLATSFYLAIDKLYNYGGQYKLKPRIGRLLIPYGFWTILYILYKVVKYLIDNEANRLNNLFKDPVSLIFLGGAAFHLYFLPLIASGTLLVKLSEYMIKKNINLKNLMYLSIISMGIYELIIVSGNYFQIGANIAFQPLVESIWPDGNKNQLLRIILVEISWILRCLPYVLIAMVLTHPYLRETFFKITNNYTVIWGTLFLMINLFGETFVSQALYEVGRGYLTLLFAISLSTYLQDNSLIKNLGICAFGIYLLHLFVVEAFQIVGNKINSNYESKISTLTLLTISLLSFIISWIFTYLLLKRKSISKIMFGS